jgi:hypothetical protein
VECEVPQLKLPTFVDASVQIVINDPFTVPSAYGDGVWNEVMRTNPAMALDANVCNKPVYVQNDDWFKEKDRGAVVHGIDLLPLTFIRSSPLAMIITTDLCCCDRQPTTNRAYSCTINSK